MNYENAPVDPTKLTNIDYPPVTNEFAVSFDFRLTFKTEAEAQDFSSKLRDFVFSKGEAIKNYSAYSSVNYNRY